MIQKIKEALKQGHKNLGLSDEVFERVAASVQTFITDEAQIEGFVKSEDTLNLLKSYQSVNDKLRTLEKKPKEEAAHKGTDEGKDGAIDNKDEQPDFKGMLAEAVAELINPLKEELAGLKAERAAETAINTAEEAFKSNDYVKKYTDEARHAWDIAAEIYELGGKKMSVDELKAKAMDYFNSFVKDKGVDTSKPFESEGSGGSENEMDVEEIKRALRERGNLPKE